MSSLAVGLSQVLVASTWRQVLVMSDGQRKGSYLTRIEKVKSIGVTGSRPAGTRTDQPSLLMEFQLTSSVFQITILPKPAKMPPLARLRPLARLSQHHRTSPALLHRSYATGDPYSDKVAANDPSPPKPVQNVSESNAVPVSAMGLRDAPMQEAPEDSEKQRQMQAPNRAEVWSRSQASRETAMSGPRFEQTMMQFQVRGLSFSVGWREGGAG